ncbi:MAG TPA: hypothetical protein VIG25_16295 [Pyrinomonadaceae bacterium]|jgi:hypothetical protein
MAENQSNSLTAKSIGILVVVAIVTAVVVTLLQTLILGRANVAVTGGVVGALTVALWMNSRKKGSS